MNVSPSHKRISYCAPMDGQNCSSELAVKVGFMGLVYVDEREGFYSTHLLTTCQLTSGMSLPV